MRRGEYEMVDRTAMERLLEEVGHGYLGITRGDGWPLVVPLNFVFADGRIYVHGAREGEKMESLAHDDRVSFIVVKDYSVIPSYFRDPRLACPATQYYQSVAIRGRARIVSDLEEKARALQALMEKLQPEGGYEPIRASDPLYRKSVLTTAVIGIEVESMTAKFKFGQNIPTEKRRHVADRLLERGCPIDHDTVEAMARFNKRS